MHVLAGTVARTCGDRCSMKAFPANVYDDRRKRLQGRLQTFASERGKTGTEIASPVLDERKGGSIRVTIVPRKILLSGQEPR